MKAKRKTVLWWGRTDLQYSRNAILRGLMERIGLKVAAFKPAISRFGDAEASLRGIETPDIVWVACFRQRDLEAACRWARRRGAKVVFDPLVSAYLKQVFERVKFPASSRRAMRLLKREQSIFSLPDVIVADTSCHAAAFCDILGVRPENVKTVYVGAEEQFFQPAPLPARDKGTPVEVLFYGSFIPLHGAETIVKAAQMAAGENIKWTLLGDGPMRTKCMREAIGLDNIAFENPVSVNCLAQRIHKADILLCIFGNTPQAARVMPNKFFQSIASARPVVTRLSEAYPCTAQDSPGVRFVPPEDPGALLSAVRGWLDPAAREAAAVAALKTYRDCFSNEVILRQLEEALPI